MNDKDKKIEALIKFFKSIRSDVRQEAKKEGNQKMLDMLDDIDGFLAENDD